MRKKIGELLVEAGATTAAEVQAALGAQKARRQRLGEIMIASGKVSASAVAQALATQYELPFIQLPDIPAKVSAIVPLDFQAQHHLVPFKLELDGKNERLHLAVADPSSLDVVDELRFQINKPVRVYVAATDDIDNTLSSLRGESMETIEPILEEEPEPPAPRTTPVEVPASVEVSLDAAPPSELPEEWSIEPAPLAPAPKPAPAPPPVAPAPAPVAAAKPAPPPKVAPPPAVMPVEVEDLPSPFEVPTRVSTVTAAMAAASASTRPPAPPVAAPPAAVAAPSPKPAPPVSSPDDFDLGLDFEDSLPGLPSLEGAPPREPATLRIQLPPAEPPPAAPVPAPAPAKKNGAPEKPLSELSEEDFKILEAIETLAGGGETELESAKVKPAQMVASLIRLLMRKGVINDIEFLEELGRK